MKRIGVTGGMGSGKSYVCRLVAEAGFPVYWADKRAKELMANDPELVALITKAFGPESYHSDGSLNRVYIAQTVFPNPQQLQRMNNLVHPVVGRDYDAWAAAHAAEGKHKAIFKETAILFEAKLEHQSDEVWLVYAPKEMRINRILQRDGITRQQALERMARQWTDQVKIQRAETLIFNDDRHPVEKQVHKLLTCLP